ncbi:AGC protein kinase Gad8 [Puccinia graminis f. sp. tritici]|uniref:non-specific serine/threonine protein kinase n=1 Tax=Puccinia graminis f. sp. tritici TaxID=56615 RepID=A0A5B0M7D9_PUCGR|nr:AGC protein kinase Gad8 [Puccinia graminis f. sp. tritici]
MKAAAARTFGKKPKDSVPSSGSDPKADESVDNKPGEARSLKVSSPGTLVIRIVEATGLKLPEGTELPERIQRALESDAANSSSVSGSVGPGLNSKASHRVSVHRKQKWWLPYCILTYDKNEILVDAVGGALENPGWMYRADFDVSRASDVTVSAYLRTAPGHDRQDMGNDLLISSVTFSPNIQAKGVTDAWYSASSGEGKFHVQVMYKASANDPLTIDSFELLKVIGKGSFGKVMQVRKKDTGRIYALKTIRKAHIVSRSEVTHTLAERTVLAQITNPFIVPLKFCFQNPDKLYLVLSFINGGELFHHLQREGRFSEERSRLYTAELLSALECLHSMDVIYRDLKPENILLDYTGHIALCDFGLCKLNMGEAERTNTFCGTPEYLAPEVIKGEGYGKTIDWWTLGILLYEMLSGLPPYYDEDHHTMYRKILKDPLTFPAEIKPDARALLTGLLDRDPNTRLGARGAEDIKRHAFFAKSIDWDRLNSKGYRPPFKPSVESAADASNFDSEFTSEMPMDSVVEDSHLSEIVQQQFEGFTFNPAGEYMSESVRD